MDLSCPLPQDPADCITIGHGGGGRLSQRLLEEIFLPAFGTMSPEHALDAFTVEDASGKMAFTTDSHVVHPLFFPGGDIGKLAVCGTVNDLAMSGARPRWLSVGFILEEGLPMETLRKVVDSMAATAKAAGVSIVAGDTKVVERGKADGLYLTTAGIGTVDGEVELVPGRITPGDAVIVSGDIGRHGMAIMAQREGLAFDAPLVSDCAPLHEAVQDLLAARLPVRCLRDCTRGGLATVLVELARQSGRCLHLSEEDVPVTETVRAACELLGIDPLYVANEGCFAAVVANERAAEAVDRLRAGGFPEATRIGEVAAETEGAGRLFLQNAFGIRRPLDLISGEQLPRIC